MVPDVVTGDFDSIREDVVEFYRARGCRIAHNPSQDNTDFEKALALVAEAQRAGGSSARHTNCYNGRFFGRTRRPRLSHSSLSLSPPLRSGQPALDGRRLRSVR